MIFRKRQAFLRACARACVIQFFSLTMLFSGFTLFVSSGSRLSYVHSFMRTLLTKPALIYSLIRWMLLSFPIILLQALNHIVDLSLHASTPCVPYALVSAITACLQSSAERNNWCKARVGVALISFSAYLNEISQLPNCSTKVVAITQNT